MKPKLKLIIDIKADIKNAQWFVKQNEFVNKFLPLNFQYITSKKFSLPERNKIISEYTKHIYFIRKQEIFRGVEDIKKQWLKIENRFYNIVDEIFQGHSWPKGKYTGYASIYLMFPRNIKKQIFYFPYSKNMWNPLSVIAHEMLHFVFFDYIKIKYNIEENDEFKGKNKKYLWQVSEAFNTVIENWEPYRIIFGTSEKNKPYPGCEKIFSFMTKQWRKKQDIKSLLDEWL